MTQSKAVTWASLPLFAVISVGLWQLIPGIGAAVGAVWLAMLLFVYLEKEE